MNLVSIFFVYLGSCNGHREPERSRLANSLVTVRLLQPPQGEGPHCGLVYGRARVSLLSFFFFLLLFQTSHRIQWWPILDDESEQFVWTETRHLSETHSLWTVWLTCQPKITPAVIFLLFLFVCSYLNAIQTLCPHILRYLVVAILTNRRRRHVIKDVIEIIKQVDFFLPSFLSSVWGFVCFGVCCVEWWLILDDESEKVVWTETRHLSDHAWFLVGDWWDFFLLMALMVDFLKKFDGFFPLFL